MSSARERQKKRKQKRTQMVRRAGAAGTPKQTQRADSFQFPKIPLPNNPLVYIVPTGIIIMIGVIYVLGLIFGDRDDGAFPNAIWLNPDWTYAGRSEEEIRAFANTLHEHEIGIVYAFTSSLKSDLSWSGREDGLNRFSEVEEDLREFVSQLRQAHPGVQIFAWIEVQTNISEIDLSDEGTQETVGEFSRQAITRLNMDGVFLDIKPLWTPNPDVPPLIRAVRRSIGMDTPLAIAVQPDLTPDVVGMAMPSLIAPGTVWDDAFRQRIALQADQLVITAYHSYRENPLDYMNWVAYQIETYVDALSEIGATDTAIIISVPSYTADPPAHDPSVESLAAALDGVNIGMQALDEETRLYVQGIAIFADADLSQTDWQLIQDKWSGE
jgi:hypothetical protein